MAFNKAMASWPKSGIDETPQLHPMPVGFSRCTSQQDESASRSAAAGVIVYWEALLDKPVAPSALACPHSSHTFNSHGGRYFLVTRELASSSPMICSFSASQRIVRPTRQAMFIKCPGLLE